ncbi:hypothetical protein L209DRAFT_197941 [Thermothelomyces heterothallicus CBS 203.75]
MAWESPWATETDVGGFSVRAFSLLVCLDHASSRSRNRSAPFVLPSLSDAAHHRTGGVQMPQQGQRLPRHVDRHPHRRAGRGGGQRRLLPRGPSTTGPRLKVEGLSSAQVCVRYYRYIVMSCVGTRALYLFFEVPVQNEARRFEKQESEISQLNKRRIPICPVLPYKANLISVRPQTKDLFEPTKKKRHSRGPTTSFAQGTRGLRS